MYMYVCYSDGAGVSSGRLSANREFKLDVYGRRQTVNISSVFLFF